MPARGKIGDENGARFDPAPTVRRPPRPANKLVASNSRKDPFPTRRIAPRNLARMFMISSHRKYMRTAALAPPRVRSYPFPPHTSVVKVSTKTKRHSFRRAARQLFSHAVLQDFFRSLRSQTLNSRRTSSAISAISPTVFTRTEFCSSIPIANRVLSSCSAGPSSITAVKEARRFSRRIPASIWE